MTKRRTRIRRSDAGSMLVLTVLLGAGLMAAAVLLLIAVLIFMRFDQTQAQVQPFTCALAEKFNADNRLGQLNEMTECSRELTYQMDTLQQQCANTEAPYRSYAPLVDLLANDSAAGQKLLTDERQVQVQQDLCAVKESVETYNKIHSLAVVENTAFVKQTCSQITDIELGYGDDVASSANIEDNSLASLKVIDQKFVSNGDLFSGNVDAKLPGHEDTSFAFSSLPANVQGYTTPARMADGRHFRSIGKLFEAGKFRQLKSEFVPTNLKVTERIMIESGVGQHSVQVSALSACSGAWLAPWQCQMPQQ